MDTSITTAIQLDTPHSLEHKMSYATRSVEQVAFILGFAFITSLVTVPVLTFILMNFR